MEFAERDKSYVWSAVKTQKLISLYKNYPCLFDTKSAVYKDKMLRQEVWQHLADEMGTTKGEIVKKIRGLRTQFAREKAKQAARSRWGESSQYVNCWSYYDSLLFLDDFVTTRNRSNIDWVMEYGQESVEEIGDDDESSEQVNQASADVYEVPEQVKHEIEEANDFVIVPSSSQGNIRKLNSYSLLQAKNLPTSKRKRSNPSSSSNTLQLPAKTKETQPSKHTPSPTQTLKITSYATASEEPQSPPVSSTNIEIPDDNKSSSGEDDEIFAKYITSELRQIKDPHVKRIVKHKIQNIIFEAHCSLRK